MYINSLFLTIYFREWRGGREKQMFERKTCQLLSTCPDWGSNPQPGSVSWVGIDPLPSDVQVDTLTNWDIPARGKFISVLNNHNCLLIKTCTVHFSNLGIRLDTSTFISNPYRFYFISQHWKCSCIKTWLDCRANSTT